MRIPTLPPHIGWPLLIVGLLSLSISASVYTLFASQSDGGPAVVGDYYAKGLKWEESAAARKAGQALSVNVQILKSESDARLRPVELTVRTRDGAPLTGLTGTVRAFRPQTAGAQSTIPLQSLQDRPGVYRQQLPIEQSGLWDFEIQGTYDGTAVEKRVRVEVSL